MTPIVRWTTRLVGAGLLGATAGIHAYLYDNGYKSIPKIGPLFLLLVISASILCLAMIGTPERLLGFVAFAGAGLELITLLGLLIFTHHTIFNFMESTQAKFYYQSVFVELAGGLVMGGIVVAKILKRSPSPASGSASRA